MKNEKLFRAIGGVGDDLIERAAHPARRSGAAWLKWAALAACCALVVGVAALSMRPGKTTAPAASAELNLASDAKLERAESTEDLMEAEVQEEQAAAQAPAEEAPAESPPEKQDAQLNPDAGWIVFGGAIYSRVDSSDERAPYLADGSWQAGSYLGDVAASSWQPNVTGRPVYTIRFEDAAAADLNERDYVAVDTGAEDGGYLFYRYAAPMPDLSLPFTAYLPDSRSDSIDIYTADRQVRLGSVPYALIGSLSGYARFNVSSGWLDGTEIYAGVCGTRVWVLAVAPPALGVYRQSFCYTDAVENLHITGADGSFTVHADSGADWQIAAPDALYYRRVTGAAFASPDVGFISYECYEDYGPVIYKTIDGGMTWQRLTIPVPEAYAGYRLEAQTPEFYSENGSYPIEAYDLETGELRLVFRLITRDGGESWSWE